MEKTTDIGPVLPSNLSALLSPVKANKPSRSQIIGKLVELEIERRSASFRTRIDELFTKFSEKAQMLGEIVVSHPVYGSGPCSRVLYLSGADNFSHAVLQQVRDTAQTLPGGKAALSFPEISTYDNKVPKTVKVKVEGSIIFSEDDKSPGYAEAVELAQLESELGELVAQYSVATDAMNVKGEIIASLGSAESKSTGLDTPEATAALKQVLATLFQPSGGDK